MIMKKLIKKIKGKLDYWKRTLSFFYWSPNFNYIELINPLGLTFKEVDNISSLSTYTFEQDLRNDYEQRLNNGDILCLLEDQGKIACYGWVNRSGIHIFGELDAEIHFDKSEEVLYDFFTDAAYRGKGLYPSLLTYICQRNSNIKIGYSFPENISSVKGLNKGGFKFICDVTGFNKNKIQKVLNSL
jgi:GNAT superfamily N-acetyltransferase